MIDFQLGVKQLGAYFGSHKGAEAPTVYHTFIATCKMSALSLRQFLKSYFTAIMEGRTDFENLAPAILGKSNF